MGGTALVKVLSGIHKELLADGNLLILLVTRPTERKGVWDELLD